MENVIMSPKDKNYDKLQYLNGGTGSKTFGLASWAAEALEKEEATVANTGCTAGANTGSRGNGPTAPNAICSKGKHNHTIPIDCFISK
jgi:hypothetical protein